MPYTISHASALLPFSKLKRFPLKLAMISSMIPDLGYYLFLPHSWNVLAHEAITGAIIGIPLSLFIYKLFKAQQKYSLPAKLLACFIGIESHIVWDAFSHKLGFGVVAFPILSEEIFGLALYKIIQYSSSVIGLLLIHLHFRNSYPQWLFQKLVLKKLFLISVAIFLIHLPFFKQLQGSREFVVALVLAMTRSAALALLLVYLQQKLDKPTNY